MYFVVLTARCSFWLSNEVISKWESTPGDNASASGGAFVRRQIDLAALFCGLL
jgi:hypothetical protein